MTRPIISIRGLGKRYHLGARAGHNTLRDQITASLRRIFSGGEKADAAEAGEFWAIKDVSFNVAQGEVLGVIGRNGAGKSTLLKVLSQITEPTEGEVRMRGRIASLLEVGTGFHPELSGRENVYLNGAILGMTKAEIRRKFDEIVAFAEVEKFLDTPVKRYSSGMYVRLAFAVAAHLEPEILIIDEVLAVGDATFQKKCLGKMKEVGASGRTVLFVSHNMSAVRALCSRCVVLQNGALLADLPPGEAVSLYLREAEASDSFLRPAQPGGRPTLVSGRIVSQPDAPTLRIALEIAAGENCRPCLDLRLVDGAGVPVAFGSLGTLDGDKRIALSPGSNALTIELPTSQLANGSYFITLDLSEPFVEYFDRAENCLSVNFTRAPSVGGVRIIAQAWGCGSVEIPISIARGQTA